ncbi:serine hydrolase domain-containing protein [Paeniglutamicibacter sulfureus]|uniref:CubicO group peptidase (Beta-lactamase class C family) n=1 Tax=Paeniglutamicibacter sulfureus TaxID=43666 RepID=A0ABU2BKH5_9MICC|nr:serine hydrolase domain-containing protein [Paeniglutamicibacter sulfureus]MDR7358821.1 CubicO group peptidase (beta-lactamase class C family) [Paeniglutamicibacter sulfureus]
MSAHLNAETLELLETTIRNDINEGTYDGARIMVARHGEVGLDATIGWADRAGGRKLKEDDIFRVLSLTKAFTNALVYQALGEGKLQLSTRVVDVIPEFWGVDRFRTMRKDRVNLAHLLTHRSGMPATPEPLPTAELGNLENVIAAICKLDVIHEPGTNLTYSPAINHALMGEMLRRVYGASSFRELAEKNLFSVLDMKDTRFGPLDEWKERVVPLKAYIPDSGWLSPKDVEDLNDVVNEDAEMPWVGSVSTARDVFAFAEMIRRNGQANGKSVIAPAILDAATTLQTGDMTNDLYAMIAKMRGWEEPPGNFGLGFSLSGTGTHPSFFGPFTSPRTHGNYGAGSTLFWIDPERDMTFVCLTSGVMDEGDNVLRFQKLSTIAASAAL